MELSQQPVELTPDALFILTQNDQVKLEALNEEAKLISSGVDTETVRQQLAKHFQDSSLKSLPIYFHLDEYDYAAWIIELNGDALHGKTLVQFKQFFTDGFAETASQRLFETSPDCLKLLDADGKLQRMNQNGCQLMEIDYFPTLQNKEWWALWPGETRQTVKDSVEKAKRGETSVFQAFCPTAKGTPKWWDVVVSPVIDQHHRVVQIIASSRDITLIKETEKQLRENIENIRLEEQRKIDFIKMISHELRTPVTSIGGYSQLLLDSIEENGQMSVEQVQYPLQRINAQVQRLSRLINNLLDVSRSNADTPDFKPELFSLAELVHHTVNDVRYINRGCNIVVEETVPVMVYADRHKIEQALMNLLTNAIKFSYLGSEVVVRMHQPALHMVEVCITDHGIGMNQQELDKIYDRFYRVEQQVGVNYTGLGIGLYLVKQIAEQHGGSVEVKSEQGQGSTFCFTIPTATA